MRLPGHSAILLINNTCLSTAINATIIARWKGTAVFECNEQYSCPDEPFGHRTQSLRVQIRIFQRYEAVHLKSWVHSAPGTGFHVAIYIT